MLTEAPEPLPEPAADVVDPPPQPAKNNKGRKNNRVVWTRFIDFLLRGTAMGSWDCCDTVLQLR